MNKHKMLWTSLVIALFLVIAVAPAQSAGINVIAEITAVNSSTNPFATSVGSTYNWSMSYNEANVAGTGFDIETATALSGPVGNHTFTEPQDIEYPDWPKLLFMDGSLIGIDFTTGPMWYNSRWTQLTTLPDPLASPRYNNFSIFDTTTPGTSIMLVEGKFQGLVGVVPEPATMLLLGSALVLLAAARRRFRKS